MYRQQQEIASRIKELREILDIDVVTMAKKLDISIEEYYLYEKGKKGIPISTLYKIAGLLHVDYTVLLTGEDPKMSTYSVVRNGEGIAIDRFEGYHFESLAYNFKHKVMEPMLVTLEPKKEEPPLVMHEGQEFNLCLLGKMKVTIGKNEIILSEGDSIYFNPQLPHGQAAVEGTAKFLTVITE